MNLLANWKTALATLVVFAFSMVFLPGFTTIALAEDTASPSDTGAATTESDLPGAAAAEGAGAAGGETVFAGMSAGTVTAGVVVVAAGIAIIAASSGGDSSSSSHH